MGFPIDPPILPMLAARVEEIPSGDSWIFEPKWDGFRALVFRDGDALYLQSRDGKPLARYFPDLIAPLKAQLPERCVVDGEIVIAQGDALDFDALQLRLHPAESRVKMLAEQMPASMVLFDVLAIGDEDLRDATFRERRARLERLRLRTPLHVTPATRDRDLAADWFQRFEGAGFDGVIVKDDSLRYQANKRVMIKVKHERDCDCVVMGFRWHKSIKGAIGSLLLGLYKRQPEGRSTGELQMVGGMSSFSNDKRKALVKKIEPFRDPSHARLEGETSRWRAGKDSSWEPLEPKLVVEVAYDHMQGDRFRHTAQFRRWRPDRSPRDCTFDQLEVVPPAELKAIFAGEGEKSSRTTRAAKPSRARPSSAARKSSRAKA